MYIEVIATTAAGHDVALQEPTDFTSLSVRVPASAEPAELAELLTRTGWGRLSGPDKIELQVQRLRAELGADSDPELHEKFDAMLDFAMSKGWVRAEGALVDAHIEWS